MGVKLKGTLGRCCVLAALLVLSACGSGELKGHVGRDDDGELITDMSQVPALEEVYSQPRRYPFTVAVAPLYVEWADGGVNAAGESSVHPLTLATPVPNVDVSDHAPTRAWPEGVDAEEEALILEALRKGFVREEEGEAPAEGEGAGPDEALGPATGPEEGVVPDEGEGTDEGEGPDEGTGPDEGMGPDEGGEGTEEGPPDDGTPDEGMGPDEGTTPGEGTPDEGATPEEDTDEGTSPDEGAGPDEGGEDEGTPGGDPWADSGTVPATPTAVEEGSDTGTEPTPVPAEEPADDEPADAGSEPDYPWPESEGRPSEGDPLPLETEAPEPRDDAPADEAPAEPRDDAPADEAAAEPMDDAPADEAPAEPRDDAPADEAPAEPVDDAPADEAPAEPRDEAPANDAPAGDPWADSGTVPDAVDESPVDEAPATPTDESPMDEAPATPMDEAPVDEAPAEPMDEAPAEDPWRDSGVLPEHSLRLRRLLRRYPSRNAAPPPDGDEDAPPAADDEEGEDAEAPAEEPAEEPTEPEAPSEDTSGDPLSAADLVLPAPDAQSARLGLLLPEGFSVEGEHPLRIRDAESLLAELDARPTSLAEGQDTLDGLQGVVPGELGEEEPQAIELGGEPGVKFTLVRSDGTRWVAWGALVDGQAFVLTSPADADPELQQTLLSSVEFAGPAPAPTPTEDPAEVAARQEREAARARESDTFEGKNFAISEGGWQDRTVGLLRQFGVFERVEKIEFSQDSQRQNPLELLPLADLAGADMLLVATLRRNKVSYQGINAAYAGDFVLWLTLWWPSAIWPGVSSEDYRADVELQVELLDVRSQEVLWSKTYRHDETLALSTPERGWVPWGVVFARFGVLTDGMLAGAGEHVRTPTWLEVEYQILRDLWSVEGFKGVVDTQTFEERINTHVEPRRLALVAGVSTYGPRARPVLDALGAERAAARGETLEDLRETYGDDELTFGVRPYAQADVERLDQFLREQGNFNQDFSRSLSGPAATRTRLKAGLRQLARARRDDPVLLYLNLRTAVVDDPEAPGDRLRKYLLPYDADLAALEAILAQPATPERRLALVAELERTAISFEWLEETFNHASLEDHRYLQSREVLIVLDTAFPDPVLGLRYAPEFAARRDEEAELRLSSDFLEPLAQVPGRLVVVGAQFFERPLDVVPKHAGGLVYHLLRGALEDGRVSMGQDATKPIGRLLDYARRQIEKESRTLNRAQSVLVLGTNRDFPVVDRR